MWLYHPSGDQTWWKSLKLSNVSEQTHFIMPGPSIHLSSQPSIQFSIHPSKQPTIVLLDSHFGINKQIIVTNIQFGSLVFVSFWICFVKVIWNGKSLPILFIWPLKRWYMFIQVFMRMIRNLVSLRRAQRHGDMMCLRNALELAVLVTPYDFDMCLFLVRINLNLNINLPQVSRMKWANSLYSST